MGVGELTDRGSVLRAIQEYDEIGQRAFLAKYGFRESRSFWLLHEGNRYDSKAIVGAAFGYQFPDRGPLPAHEFSGGDHTVKPVLENLGFVVEVYISPAQIRRWIWGLQIGSLPDGQRAPHKPLLLLLAMRRVAEGHVRLEPVVEVAAALGDLLRQALPSVDEPSPWEPIWRLEEELWEITDPSGPLVRPGDTDPPIARLRQPDVLCGFTESVYSALKDSPEPRQRLEDDVVDRYLVS